MYIVGNEHVIINEFDNLGKLFNATDDFIDWDYLHKDTLTTKGIVITKHYFVFNTKYHPLTSADIVSEVMRAYRKFKVNRILK